MINNSMTIDNLDLVNGCYDLHVHSSPDLLPRKISDLELAKKYVNYSMGGFASKSHFFCTAERAEITNSLYPSCREIGTVCLNNGVGGLNPVAVDFAARAGAKIVWLPTCDAQWERMYSEKKAGNKAFWFQFVEDLRKTGIDAPGISLLNDNGKLKGSVLDILEIVRTYNIALCTGHISHQETFAVANAAHDMKFNNLIITHVTFPSTFYSVAEQQMLVTLGAHFEQCYSTYATGKVDFETIVSQIKAIGPEYYVLGTDLGQPSRLSPEEGMLSFVSDLYSAGFTKEEIRIMCKYNCEQYVLSN